MSLLTTFQYYMPTPSRYSYTRHYLAFEVEHLDGTKHWYRLNRKLYMAVKQHQYTHHGQFPLQLVGHAYINVPLTPYFGHNIASIGVGKITHIGYRIMNVNDLCARSQFVMDTDLQKSLRHCYHYMRHDFNTYSNLQIFVDLYEWKKRLGSEKTT